MDMNEENVAWMVTLLIISLHSFYWMKMFSIIKLNNIWIKMSAI